VTSNSPTTTTKEVVEKILNKLAEAAQPLPSSLELYRQVLLAQSKFKPDAPQIISQLKEKIPQRLSQNKPMLTLHEIILDWTEFKALFLQINDLAKKYLSPSQEEIKVLERLSTNPELLNKAVKDWFGSNIASTKGKAKKSSLNPVTGSTLQSTLYPWLTTYASKLLPLIKVEVWRKQYCPVCGGSPDFAYLEKEKGERWLVCSRCDAQWPFYRLTCPYCSNQEHKDLAYFTNDKGLYRLYVCEKCHRYIKAIDTRKTSEEVLLPLERVMTLDMDRQAVEQGYKAED